jgi:hypothetical protein
MAPIVSSTTGIPPQPLESLELIQLLHNLKALPLVSSSFTTKQNSTTENDDNNNASMEHDRPGEEEVGSSTKVMMTMSDQTTVQQLIRILEPYQNQWSFEETVRTTGAVFLQ